MGSIQQQSSLEELREREDLNGFIHQRKINKKFIHQ